MISLREAITQTRELYNKTKPHNNFDNYEEHIIAVGTCASILAAACGLNVMKAGIMGYCHDIGKMISDERKDKTFHGLTGYEYFKSIGENELAQICLTHSFPDININTEEYYCYGTVNIEKAQKILKKIHLTDYDRIIQLADLLINFNGYTVYYDSLKDRMKYIEKNYKIKPIYIKNKYRNAIKLKKYLEQKYNFNIYNLLGIK